MFGYITLLTHPVTGTGAPSDDSRISRQSERACSPRILQLSEYESFSESGKWEERFSCVAKEGTTVKGNERIDAVTKLKGEMAPFIKSVSSDL